MVATEAEKICKQVEFYFSDSNLPYDKFLWTLRANTPEGWIPIETIASFKKMKMITEDLDVVVKALKENESEIYELDAESKNIRRKSEVVEQDHTSRSVYVKGLPLVDVDAKDPISELFILQDKIDDLFSEKAKVLCVRLKKTNDRPKKFKGSAYVEFENPEEAQKIAELKDIELDGNKLEIIYKPKYHEMKAEEYKQNPQSSKRFYGFNAFKAQHLQSNSNKRKSSGGFTRDNNKKSKAEAVVEESKKDEAAPVAAETKEAEPTPAAEETN